MQRTWKGKNVDLERLSDCVEGFFTSRKLLRRRADSAGEFVILWLPQRTRVAMKEPASVRITGVPDDFTIDLRASELTTRSIRAGMLTKPFGGGYFLLKAVKLREELERLEREFWVFVEEEVAQLAGSARLQQNPSS